jgi:hypothetical protein
VVVEVVVVEVEVVEVEVEVVVVEVDVVDGLEAGLEDSISVDEMIVEVSIGGVFSELDDSGGAVVISGTVFGCATKVVTSSICFVSATAAAGAEVILVLAWGKSLAKKICFINLFTLCTLHGINNVSLIFSGHC